MTGKRPKTMQTLEPGVRRVLAANPSPMTHWGTNTYIVGQGRVAVIDPGPGDPGHFQSILDSLAPGETISHIFVTHSHLDHSPLARPLAEKTGAPVLAFGDSQAGRSPLMKSLALGGLVGGGEGVDPDFRPDETLADGTTVTGSDWQLTAIWTPGHFGNHLSFAWNDIAFTGDHIMGWASSLVSPPDGDLTEFMASTRRLARRNDRVFYPGHGDPVDDPTGRANWLVNHRHGREQSILAVLQNGPCDIKTLTARIYTDIPPALIPAAERNVFAHLIDLVHHFKVTAEPYLGISARYSLI